MARRSLARASASRSTAGVWQARSRLRPCARAIPPPRRWDATSANGARVMAARWRSPTSSTSASRRGTDAQWDAGLDLLARVTPAQAAELLRGDYSAGSSSACCGAIPDSCVPARASSSTSPSSALAAQARSPRPTWRLRKANCGELRQSACGRLYHGRACARPSAACAPFIANLPDEGRICLWGD